MCMPPSPRQVLDPISGDVHNWGRQALQPWQDAVISEAERGPLAALRAAVKRGGSGGGAAGAGAE
jgi:hypothetical protein